MSGAVRDGDRVREAGEGGDRGAEGQDAVGERGADLRGVQRLLQNLHREHLRQPRLPAARK